MADLLWFVAVAIGPVMLGAAIAYALLRQRRLSAREKRAQNDAVRRLYKNGRE